MSENAHLFVLIHGLWGGPNHMLTIERAVHQSLAPVSKEKVVTLKPLSFRFWKTYDGLAFIADRVIADILYEIETLKEKQGYTVTKISIVGYSLGGLIARYVIGVLEELGFFDHVQPVFYLTFATPHVGVEFFRQNFFEKTANLVGPYFFGQSGKQLFIADLQKLVVQMADPDSHYFKGLLRFQKHILLANIKNDRTVAFFTSYISEHLPFDSWDNVKIEYFPTLPEVKIGRNNVKPKIVDFAKTSETDVAIDNAQEATSILRSNKLLRLAVIVVGASFLIPVWIPLVLTSSMFASIYSMLKVRVLLLPPIQSHWARVQKSVYEGGTVDEEDAKQGEQNRQQRRKLAKHESFKGDTSNLTENTMENILYVEERIAGGGAKPVESDDDADTDDSATEQEDEPFLFSRRQKVLVNTKENDAAAMEYLESLAERDLSKSPLVKERTKLKLSDEKQQVIANLNKIDWIKIPVYLDLFNAHDGIVARRGERTNPKGLSIIYFWTSILRNHIKE